MRKKRDTLVNAIAALPAFGHVSIAVIYITMGVLTLLVFFGMRGSNPDVRTTIYALKEQPFGSFFLLVILFSSLALAIYRGLQAFADLEEKGAGWKGLAMRARYVGAMCIYLGMSGLVGRIWMNQPTPGGDHLARESASRLSYYTSGQGVLMIIGIILAVISGVYFYRALLGNFKHWFRCHEMSRAQQACCFAFGRVGYASRGLVLLMIAWIFFGAWMRQNPNEVTGQAGALNTLLAQPLGRWALPVIAIGMVAFGIFALWTAAYGKVPEKKIRSVVSEVRSRFNVQA